MVGIAHAAGGAAPQGGGFMSFLPLILIFVIFYFMLIRPQQKKAKEHQGFLSNLEKGTMVVTNGGIFGKITGLTNTVVTLEIADNIRVKVSRQHILGAADVVSAEGEAACSPKG